MTICIIYDPTNIDSITASTMLLGILNEDANVKAVPAFDMLDSSFFKEYWWVGVKPTSPTLQRHNGVHRGIFLDMDSKKDLYLEQQFKYITTWEQVQAFVEPMWENTNLTVPRLLATIVAVVWYKDQELDSVWKILQSIAEFNNNKLMPLTDQALLWSNVNHAKKVLQNSPTKLQYVFEDHISENRLSQLVDDYLAFLKIVKYEISDSVSQRSISINNSTISFPVLNLKPDITPWVLRLVSLSSPLAVVYSDRRGYRMYSLCGGQGLQDALTDVIKQKHHQCQQIQHCFSNRL